LVLGILPSWLLWKLPVNYRRWHRELVSKVIVSVASVAVIGGVALANYQGLSSLFRNHHELRLMLVPSNYIGASAGYLREQLVSARQPFLKIGEDAQRDPALLRQPRKSLTVLVVGESARAENFGILGYPRDTTPELDKEAGLIAFTDVHSCGTETAVSVPCMFSTFTRKQYDASKARNQEGLLDVLQRAGIAVHWRDNQSGCKGTCDRVAFEDVSNLKDPALCADSECHDEILLKGLEAMLDNLQQDTVLVLHQMGSHGPEYFKRYPKAYERFTPVCRSNALDKCDRQSIINGYDNTLVYTDHVLATLIDVLRSRQDKVDTAMLYLSDHGESLGEYNLFLHGTPYMLAPEQQKHIPMLAWFSDGYRKDYAVDTDCLQRSRNQPLSQDNLFHSMLGLLRVHTSVYDPQLDMFASCRPVVATH
jgi:lipid A ethanolaminephosphotransferase